MRKSIRYCASPRCDAQAIYGAFCITHLMEHDPDHMAFIEWGEPCEDPSSEPTVHDSSYPARRGV